MFSRVNAAPAPGGFAFGFPGGIVYQPEIGLGANDLGPFDFAAGGTMWRMWR
jgi:hypothetical protein